MTRPRHLSEFEVLKRSQLWLRYLLAGLSFRLVIVESRPPRPVGSDDEDAEDEEDEEVVDLAVSGSDDETGLGDEETNPNGDIHIPEVPDNDNDSVSLLSPDWPLLPQTVLAGVTENVEVANHPETGQTDPYTGLNKTHFTSLCGFRI